MKATPLILITVLSSLCGAHAARAADTVSLHVKPTTLTLTPGQNAAVITITNEGAAPINAQVRVFGWDQAQDKDQLSETDKLVASPPAATFAPGQSQSIRVVRTAKAAATAEESYRLWVDEIPAQNAAPQVGVEVRMRYSLPVFVQPRSAASQGKVEIGAQVQGHNLVLTAQNNGQSHAQLADLTLAYGNGTSTPLARGLLGYVLAGKRMQWTLAIPANAATAGSPSKLSAKLNGQATDISL